jgi:hypothetical protein
MEQEYCAFHTSALHNASHAFDHLVPPFDGDADGAYPVAKQQTSDTPLVKSATG